MYINLNNMFDYTDIWEQAWNELTEQEKQQI